MPFLSTILWLPIVAAIVLAFLPRASESVAKGWGLFSSAAVFVLSLGLLRGWEDGKAGSYVFICNIAEIEDGALESHYEEGMRVAFTVE